jgi:hypothetical protein
MPPSLSMRKFRVAWAVHAPVGLRHCPGGSKHHVIADGNGYADRGHDHDKYRRMIWATGVKPVIARRDQALSARASGEVERWS